MKERQDREWRLELGKTVTLGRMKVTLVATDPTEYTRTRPKCKLPGCDNLAVLRGVYCGKGCRVLYNNHCAGRRNAKPLGRQSPSDCRNPVSRLKY